MSNAPSPTDTRARKRPTRVCVVAHSANMEGADRSLLETARLLRERGADVHVLAPGQGPLLGALDRFEIPYTVCAFGWWLGHRGESLRQRAPRYAQLALSLVTITWLRVRLQGRFDVVYSNTLASPAGALLARWLGVPHVWHVREFVEEDHGLVFLLGRTASLRFLDHHTRTCVFNSHAVARRFDAEIVQPSHEVVYQAVTLEHPPAGMRQPGRHRNRLAALVLGRVQPSKGQHIAIEAVAKARALGVAVDLTIVGGGEPPYVRGLVDLAESLGAADLVTFRDFDERPLKYVASCDVVLVCSRQEAFGRVTIEAMKLGRPVIGSASGGTTELIDEGRTGWLFAPGDASDLASKLIVADRDRSRLERMGEDGRAWAEATFSQDRYGDRMFEILSDAAHRPEGSVRIE